MWRIILINFDDFNIILNNCINKHENILLINEFDNTQNINENKIVYYSCNNNKGKTYNMVFSIVMDSVCLFINLILKNFY